MPIKLPRGFQRRRSSGNAREEVRNLPEPAFRVFARPRGATKSFDRGNTLKRFEVAVEARISPTIENGDPGGEDDELLPVTKEETNNR